MSSGRFQSPLVSPSCSVFHHNEAAGFSPRRQQCGIPSLIDRSRNAAPSWRCSGCFPGSTLMGICTLFAIRLFSQALMAGVPEAVVRGTLIRKFSGTTRTSRMMCLGATSTVSAATTRMLSDGVIGLGNRSVFRQHSFQHTKEIVEHAHITTKKPPPSYGGGFRDERRGGDSNPR